MNYDIHTNTHAEDGERKERTKKYHRTRFIIYICLWFFGGPLVLFSAGIGALLGGIQGAIICLGLGIFMIISFLILWIYHLIKGLSA